jgi:sterol desaturase/sphingolipid hydroxylase (fatty acid hydroxylase superfamily)
MEELFVIICGSTVFFGTMLLIVFAFFAYLRWLRYKETVVLAEKGLLRPERENRRGKGTLRWGIVITALGIALCLGLFPIGFISRLGYGFPLRFGPWMLLGLLPTFFGLALVLIFFITGGKIHDEPKKSEPEIVPPQPAEVEALEPAEKPEP